MIQATVINDIAAGVVGWKQPTRSGSPTVNAANLAASSGLYYQMGHGLCTVENIKAAVDDDAISDANLNTYLTDLSKNGLNDVCQAVFGDDDHIDTGLLFKHENKFSEIITNAADFVGFEFDLSKRNDLSIIINSLILEFSSAESVKVLMFNSQKSALYSSQAVTTIANTAKHTSVNWVMNDLEYGGKFYVGYLRSALTGNAIKRNFQLANLATYFKDANIRPIRVPSWNTETMFDPSTIVYESDTWGMNFNISLYNDYTQIVKSNVNRFAKALQLQVCANVVDLISNTVRSNKSERLSKAYALMELDGNRNNQNFPEHTGLISKLGSEVRKLKSTYHPTGIIRATL